MEFVGCIPRSSEKSVQRKHLTHQQFHFQLVVETASEFIFSFIDAFQRSTQRTRCPIVHANLSMIAPMHTQISVCFNQSGSRNAALLKEDPTSLGNQIIEVNVHGKAVRRFSNFTN